MSSNPRGRNMVQQTPMATRPAQLPALPPASTPFERAVKEVFDVRTSATNKWERWVTQRELEQLGLQGGLVDASLPADTQGIPVWVTRSRFQLVSISALAKGLQDKLATAAGTDVGALASLRRRIAALESNVTPAQLQHKLSNLAESLQARWRIEIAGAGDGADLSQQLEEVRALAQQAMQQATGLGSRRYNFAAATTWTVTHNLQRYPTLTVLNDAGEKIEPDVDYVDQNEIVVTHGRDTAGSVVLT